MLCKCAIWRVISDIVSKGHLNSPLQRKLTHFRGQKNYSSYIAYESTYMSSLASAHSLLVVLCAMRVSPMRSFAHADHRGTAGTVCMAAMKHIEHNPITLISLGDLVIDYIQNWFK